MTALTGAREEEVWLGRYGCRLTMTTVVGDYRSKYGCKFTGVWSVVYVCVCMSFVRVNAKERTVCSVVFNPKNPIFLLLEREIRKIFD